MLIAIVVSAARARIVLYQCKEQKMKGFYILEKWKGWK